MLYFKILCFVWAGIGIISRIAMIIMKDKWVNWEQEQAYKEKRPFWVLLVSEIGILLVILTWSVYLVYKVPYGWILSILVSFTLIKVITLLFNYNQFRTFLMNTLSNKKKIMVLNILVVLFSIGLILMGIFLY